MAFQRFPIPKPAIVDGVILWPMNGVVMIDVGLPSPDGKSDTAGSDGPDASDPSTCSPVCTHGRADNA